MADAKIRLSVEGATMAKSELDKVNAGLSSMGGEAAMLKTTLMGLVGSLSAGAFIGWAKGMIDAADAMNDMSQRTGILVKELAVYELAAKQSGTTMESISKGVKGLSGVLATNGDAMRAAGITATDTNGAMIQLSEMFSKLPDGMEKTNLAVKIFGKSGMDLIPMLNMGAMGMQEATDKAKKYAEQMEKMAPMADAFNDNMAEIAMNSKVMGMSMMNNALPALNEITRAMADGSQKGGTLAGIMAGLAVGFENYKKGVREVYGIKPPSTGGATGSFAPETPKVDESAPFKARIKALQDALNSKGAAGSGGADKVTEYARITQEIIKTNAVSAQELLYGTKLAASDKYRVEMMAKVEAAYTNNKISMTERVKLTEQVTAASSQMYLVEKQAYEVDAIKKNTEALDKLGEAATKANEALVADNEQKRLENETLGLTTDQLNRLILARQDEAIAKEQEALMGLKNAQAGETEIAQLERKIRLLQNQRGLTAQGQAKTAYSTLKTDVLGEAKPANSSYDPRELAGIIGAETEKVAAYNATARVVLANAEAQNAIERAQISSSRDLTAAEVERFTSLQAEIDKIRGNLELNFKISGLDDISTKLGSMADTAGKLGDGFSGASKALGGFASGLKTIAKAQADQAKTGRDSTAEQVGGYGEIAGAAKEMFDKNSAGYEVMAAIEKAMYIAKFAMQAQEIIGNLLAGQSAAASSAIAMEAGYELMSVNAANAILEQGKGDPYTAFFRMAAMAALVAGIVASAGGSGGSGGGSAGGGGAGSSGADGNYSGTGQAVNEHGQVYSQRSLSMGESSSAQGDGEQALAAYEAAEAVNKVNLSLRKLQAGATALEQDLIDVKQATQGAGQAQYELATQGLDDSETAAYNYNAALKGQITVLLDAANGTKNASKNMKSLADETVSLSIDLLKASGDIAGAKAMQRELDTAGYTSDEIAVYNYNQSLQDQIDAYEGASSAASDAAQAENELAQKRYEMSNIIKVMLGQQTQLEADRAAELAGVTDGELIALINLRNVLEDIDLNITKLKANADKAFAALERAVKVERDAASIALKSASELANSLKSSLGSMNLTQSRDNAQAQIAMFLAVAKAGGMLPSATDIQSALKSIAKPSEQLFGTFEDYQRDFLRTANDISDLSALAEDQVTDAQQQIDALDAIIVNAQSQLDKLNDIDTSIISVAGAVEGMAAAFGAAQSARDGADAARAAAVSGSGANLNYSAPSAYSGGGGGGGGYGGGAAAEYESIAGQTNKDIVAAYRAYYKRNPDAGGYDTYLNSGLSGDRLMQAILAGSGGNPEGSDFMIARSRGYDPLNPTANYLHSQLSPSGSGGGAYSEPWQAFASGGDHTGGLRLVGEMGPELEATGPSRITSTNNLMKALSNQGGNNDALVAEIRALRQEVKQLRASAERGNENTQRAADTLSGRQGVPFLVQVAS